MKSSRSKKKWQPTLFKIEKLEVAEPADVPKIERPYSLPGILLGTSSFTAKGWTSPFYPPSMKSRDYLSYYSTQFATVEIDSTFYRCPSPNTVSSWPARTPEDFTLALTDTSFMPRPWELKEPLDLITADFAYVRDSSTQFFMSFVLSTMVLSRVPLRNSRPVVGDLCNNALSFFAIRAA